ncbi:glycosyltransferase [Aeromonas media]|uniref:glycosyltransferase n=1 Tax=Aeromonas media TaxID=651 RepID=UPI0022820EDB|nr:glycosyltransferase [Aeromonas media]MCY9824123.1 glycosyltransferase [Aeromonas media]
MIAAFAHMPRYVSYWENAPGQTMTPYVALALVSMRRALGDRFLLLTPQMLDSTIDPAVMDKRWAFQPLSFTLAAGIEEIVARSDFIRMAWVQQHGGVWLDADTLMLRDPTDSLFPDGLSAKLHWHSECIFGSQPGNPLLARALAIGLAEERHAWGNPGCIKDLVPQAPEQVINISGELIDPGYRPLYNFTNCEVMRRTDLAVDRFLLRPVALLKLYNTYFRRTTSRIESVDEFLANGSLLARLFLHIEPDVSYWLAESERLMNELV